MRVPAVPVKLGRCVVLGRFRWHKNLTANVHQPPAKDPVFSAIRQDLEAKSYKLVRSLNQTERVWLQADFVSNDLEFYEIGLKQLACHACSFYRFVGTETAGSIRKYGSLGLAKQIPKRLAGIRRVSDLAP